MKRRFNLRIDEKIYNEIRQIAKDTGQPICEVIDQRLRCETKTIQAVRFRLKFLKELSFITSNQPTLKQVIGYLEEILNAQYND